MNLPVPRLQTSLPSKLVPDPLVRRVRVVIYLPSMAIGKWFAPQHTPTSPTSSQSTLDPTLAIADEKQFGLENVRDLPLCASPLFSLFL